MRTFIPFAVAALALVSACKSSESIVEDNRAAAETKLAAMRKAVQAAMDSPVTTPPELPEKLRIGTDAPNAYLVQPEWLADPPRPPEHGILVQASDFITVRNLLLGTESPTGVPEYYEKAFAGFLATRWLVVVDPAAFAGGVVTGESTFTGGGFTGTLHFVDIDKGTAIGSLPVDASASDEVEVVVSDAAKHLSSDVWMNTRAAIGATLAPLCEGGTAPL